MGGFTIETESIIVNGEEKASGNKYLLFTAPTKLNFFYAPYPDKPFEILSDPIFSQGKTANSAAQSLYKWYTTGDVTITPGGLLGGEATFEYSSGSAILQQKIINQAALPAATGSAGKVWLKFTYTIFESNIKSGFNIDGTVGSETIQTKLLLYSSILNSVPLNTDVGTHTTITRSTSVYTTTAGTEQSFIIQAFSLTAGDKVVMGNFSLTEVPAVLDQRTAAMALSGDIDAGEKYRFSYNMTEITKTPRVFVATTWLTGLLRGKAELPTSSVIHGRYTGPNSLSQSEEFPLNGTITATNGSTSVTGSSKCKFLIQIEAGDVLYNSDRTIKIGIVSSITNNQTLVLAANYGGATETVGRDFKSAIIQRAAFVNFTHNQTDGGYFDLIVTDFSPGSTFKLDDISLKKIKSSVRIKNGDAFLGGNLEIGAGVAGVDYTLTFDGETSDGVLTWMEDEDHFKFSDDVVIDAAKKLYLYDEGGEYISSSGTALTIASGGVAWEFPTADGSANQVLKTDSSGNLDWVTVTSSPITALNSATENELVTVGSTTTELDAEANLTFDGANLLISSSTSAKPVITIKTTHTDKDQSGELRFHKDAADTEDGENLGKITWYGEDEGNNNTQFAEILAEISESDETDEAGKLSLLVAESDGTNTAMTAGLVLEGEHATDGEVDVTIAAGAASTTTVSGDLTVIGPAGITINDATTSSATEGGSLVLASDDGAVMASGHRLGVIDFKGAEDTSNTLTVGGRIEVLADATWSASENGGRMQFSTTDANADTSLALTLDSNKLATFYGIVDITDSTDSTDASGDTGALRCEGGASIAQRIWVGDDIVIENDAKLLMRGTAGGNNGGITYEDSGGSGRYAMFFPGSDVVAVSNRASNGTVQIRANTATAGSGGEVTVATFADTEVTFAKPVIGDNVQVTIHGIFSKKGSADSGSAFLMGGNYGSTWSVDNAALPNSSISSAANMKDIFSYVAPRAMTIQAITVNVMNNNTNATHFRFHLFRYDGGTGATVATGGFDEIFDENIAAGTAYVPYFQSDGVDNALANTALAVGDKLVIVIVPSISGGGTMSNAGGVFTMTVDMKTNGAA